MLIEAASCERAVVATDMPGCREIVQHDKNGLLVEPHRPDLLADAIAELLRNRDRRKAMGRRGREIVLRDFDVKDVIHRTMELYVRIRAPRSRDLSGT